MQYIWEQHLFAATLNRLKTDILHIPKIHVPHNLKKKFKLIVTVHDLNPEILKKIYQRQIPQQLKIRHIDPVFIFI